MNIPEVAFSKKKKEQVRIDVTHRVYRETLTHSAGKEIFPGKSNAKLNLLKRTMLQVGYSKRSQQNIPQCERFAIRREI